MAFASPLSKVVMRSLTAVFKSASVEGAGAGASTGLGCAEGTTGGATGAATADLGGTTGADTLGAGVAGAVGVVGVATVVATGIGADWLNHHNPAAINTAAVTAKRVFRVVMVGVHQVIRKALFHNYNPTQEL